MKGLLAATAVAASFGGCGSGPSPSATGAVPAPSGAVAPGPTSGTVTGDPGATPSPWPGTTVLAVIALGAADGEIQKAGVDLQAAAESQDLRKLWGAADGLARLIEGLTPNIERLESYPVTAPAGALYRTAFPTLLAGARELRDSITAGDAPGIVSGSQRIAQGLREYDPVRRPIAELVQLAIVQQRLLLN